MIMIMHIMLYAKLLSALADSVILSLYNIAALCLLIDMLCRPPCTFHTECTDTHAWNRVIVHVFKITFLFVRASIQSTVMHRQI